MAAVVAGKPNMAILTEIDLQALAERFRLQKIVFEVARDVYDQMKPTWKGNKENLLAQVIRLVEKFIASPMLEINPPLFYQDEMKRRVMLTLNMQRIIQHVFDQIRFANTEALEAVFDSSRPIRSTGDMLPWFTGRPVVLANRSPYQSLRGGFDLGSASRLRTRPQQERRSMGEKRPSRFRRGLYFRWRLPQIPARLSDSARERRNAYLGNQRTGHAKRPDQAPIPWRVGEGGE